MVIYSVFPLQFLPLKENLIAASERRLLKLNRSWHQKFSQLGQISFQLQGHPKRMRKVNYTAGVLLFIKFKFSQLFLVEK
jgi:hypothetical protein